MGVYRVMYYCCVTQIVSYRVLTSLMDYSLSHIGVSAVAGMIAGRHYGLSKIPTEFTQNLMMYDELYNSALKLSNLELSLV